MPHRPAGCREPCKGPYHWCPLSSAVGLSCKLGATSLVDRLREMRNVAEQRVAGVCTGPDFWRPYQAQLFLNQPQRNRDFAITCIQACWQCHTAHGLSLPTHRHLSRQGTHLLWSNRGGLGKRWRETGGEGASPQGEGSEESREQREAGRQT